MHRIWNNIKYVKGLSELEDNLSMPMELLKMNLFNSLRQFNQIRERERETKSLFSLRKSLSDQMCVTKTF